MTELRVAVLVAGMHRSGTSAITGTIASSGYAAPKFQIRAGRENPKGFFEAQSIARLNDRLLACAGSMWSDVTSFRDGWLENSVRERFISDAAEAINREFPSQNKIVVKDPRICRLLPAWEEALNRLGYVPKVVIPVRHPLSVRRSLFNRDSLGYRRALALWTRYNLDAERNSRSLPRLFLSYDDFVDGAPFALSNLANFLSVDLGHDLQKTWSEIIESSLRHHKEEAEEGNSCYADLLEIALLLYNRLIDLSRRDATDEDEEFFSSLTFRLNCIFPAPPTAPPRKTLAESNILIKNGERNLISIGKGVTISGKITGDDNIIVIGDTAKESVIQLRLKGNRNRVIIGGDCSFRGLDIYVGSHVEAHQSLVRIGDRTTAEEKTEIFAYNSGCQIVIGSDCMLSREIVLRGGEMPHLIFDARTGEYLDLASRLLVGDGVWIGERAYLTKQARVSDGSIVAACSVVSRRFDEPQVVIAGNPAEIAKSNVKWIRNRGVLVEGSPESISFQSERSRHGN